MNAKDITIGQRVRIRRKWHPSFPTFRIDGMTARVTATFGFGRPSVHVRLDDPFDDFTALLYPRDLEAIQ